MMNEQINEALKHAQELIIEEIRMSFRSKPSSDLIMALENVSNAREVLMAYKPLPVVIRPHKSHGANSFK